MSELSKLQDELRQQRHEWHIMRAALEAIRDYASDPGEVGAEDMTPAQKVGGMWSQAVAALDAVKDK